jgi:arylsulfatase A-like enzyme
MTIDILPTIAHLIGARLPEHKIDGKNIWPLIHGEPDARSPHEAYYFYYGQELQAIRVGRWKLHFPHEYRTLGGRQGGKGGLPARYDQAKIGPALFDLESDVSETTDVKNQHPEVVAMMEQLADGMRKDLGDAAKDMKGSGRRLPGQLEAGDRRFVVVDGQQTPGKD